jgi:hypothetical protein
MFLTVSAWMNYGPGTPLHLIDGFGSLALVLLMNWYYAETATDVAKGLIVDCA